MRHFILQEAHKMVRDAKVKRDAAEKALKEANMKVVVFWFILILNIQLNLVPSNCHSLITLHLAQVSAPNLETALIV